MGYYLQTPLSQANTSSGTAHVGSAMLTISGLPNHKICIGVD